ncbi:battenin-like isoform X1 [Daphnia pulex]|uniref:battenin-like isoform X1 n=1 Tax=Daphnia pulex TaxID=6669 RepID=UPI001EE13076|nr:battenin-like isoform X1 [Daphnia pulex]
MSVAYADEIEQSTPYEVFDCFVLDEAEISSPKEKPRNLIAYWLLGLCNNYAYVIMLSAAHDILSEDFQGNSTVPTPSPVTNNTRDCNPVSTGAILLADVLPSLAMKLTMPFLLTHIRLRVLIVILLSSASFLMVSFSTAQWQAFLGVVFAAISGGLGEVTFLQYSSHYDKDVVSTWSSGTGGSGLFGALSFAALTTAGLSARKTVLLMLVIPALMAITFFFILDHEKRRVKTNDSDADTEPLMEENQPSFKGHIAPISMRSKCRMLPRMARFIVPLGSVYLFEYFINQGVFELIYFENIWLDHHSQYRWLQVDYQLGVFLSRSSVNLFRINAVWFLAVLQFVNVILLTTEAVFLYIPSIWIVFTIVFWEGLLAGAAYVNTFYRVAFETIPQEKAFAMGITSLAGSVGVSTAGALAVPFHQYLCSLPIIHRTTKW